MHCSLHSSLPLDARVGSSNGYYKKRRDSNSDQGQERAEIAVGKIPQADYPQAIGPRANLTNRHRLPKISVTGPTIAYQVLVQAGQVAKATRREKRSFQEKQEVQKRIDHGYLSFPLWIGSLSWVGGSALGEKSSAPRTPAPRTTAMAESFRRMIASAPMMMSALFF